jgi:very-short-patch-repair endonuclease
VKEKNKCPSPLIPLAKREKDLATTSAQSVASISASNPHGSQPFAFSASDFVSTQLTVLVPASDIVPLLEGVAEGRGRLPGETHEPLPLHLSLYNPYLQPNANDLRHRMTKAEACLWKYVLRARQMKGYTFNRQRPVLCYIADFMCKPLKLIIEVDGSVHDNPKVAKHDAFRQSELESCGFSVLRYTNDQVLNAIDSVILQIELKIDELESADFVEKTSI